MPFPSQFESQHAHQGTGESCWKIRYAVLTSLPRRSRDMAHDGDTYRIDCLFLPSFNSDSALALVTILLSSIVPAAAGTDEKIGILVITQQPYSGDRVCDRTQGRAADIRRTADRDRCGDRNHGTGWYGAMA